MTGSEHPPVLRLRGLRVTRGGVPVLRGVDLDARSGRVHVVLGASGSGKTTLLRACIGLVPAPSHVTADRLVLTAGGSEHDLTAGAWSRVRGTHVGLVGQDPALDLTPLRRVGSLVAEVAGGREQVGGLLQRSGLPGEEVPGRYCFQLSGGMAQRLSVGLARARQPALLLADEPSTALDALARDALCEQLAEVAAGGAAVLLVTHDVALARRVADDVTVLADGRAAESGVAAQVLDAPSTETTRALVRLRVHTRRSPSRETGAREPVLDVRGLHAGWGRASVLRGLDLQAGPGEIVGLLGRSGAGKSTLVACLLGLLAPTEGTLSVAGCVHGTASWRRLRRWTQMVPQDPRGSLNPWRTVAEQVRDPLVVHRVGSRAEQTDRVATLLERVGLAGLGGRRPGELSTGQCQRAAIARALAVRPRLVVADEPVTALDAPLRADVLDLFDDMVREEGSGALVISHDLHVLEQLCDRISVLDDGRIVETLPVSRLRADAEHPLTRALLDSHPPVDQRETDG